MSSFDEDMREMRRETVADVVYHVNKKPGLYNEFKGKSAKQIKELVYSYANDDDGWFGDAFSPLLDGLNRNDWAQIAKQLV